MPRAVTSVKNKALKQLKVPGAVDLHFHGAFGIDLMGAGEDDVRVLGEKLWTHHVAGYLATTLSVSPRALLETVSRLGPIVRKERELLAKGKLKGRAAPLGLHLEGPFISKSASGAHPTEVIRTLTMKEIETLWEASEQTLKILTIAPETLSPELTRTLAAWAAKKRVKLSLGHTRCTEAQAESALEHGFTGVTHAWNAMQFHHRDGGVLGATLGNPSTYIELIIDQVHLALSTIRMTQKAADSSQICFVSDCVPAAQTRKGTWHTFGDLKIEFDGHACRLPLAAGQSQAALAGGGILVTDAYLAWLKAESKATGVTTQELILETLPALSLNPLKHLGEHPRLFKNHMIRLTQSGAVQFRKAG